MQIEHEIKSIDWLYAASQLAPPSDDAGFDELRARLALFNRDGLLDVGARIMWHLWLRAAPQSGSGEQQGQITWSHAVGILGLACVYGGVEGGLQPNEADFRVLAHELFLCPGGMHLLQDDEENARLLSSLSDVSNSSASGRLRRIPATDIRLVQIAAQLARLAHTQRQGHVVNAPSRRIRHVAIYELLIAEATRRGVEVELQRAEFALLRTSYQHYVRAVQVITYAVTSAAEQPEVACPGVVIFGKSSEETASDWQGTSWTDVFVTAARLATSLDDARSYAAALEDRPDWQRPSAQEIWFLRERPLLRLQAANPDELKIFATSPWLLLHVTERELLHSIPWAAQTAQVNLLSMRGEAFHQYLALVLANQPGVLDVDSMKQLKGRRPDQIVLGQKYGLVVEAKATLTPFSDPEHRRPESVAKAWAVGCEAIQQGTDLLANPPPALASHGPRTWIKVIVTLEPGAADATYFVSAAKLWGFLEDTPFAAVHVADVAELEHVVVSQVVDSYAEMLIRRWDHLSGDFTKEHPAIDFEETKLLPYLRQAWTRIYPAETLPWG